jgi:hypothetical protein
MALEQVPGNLDLKLVKGDDFNISFNIPFDATSYVWTTSVYDLSGTTYSIITSASVQSSILTIVRCTFHASVTSLFTPISDNTSHAINITNSSYWKMKYVDSTNNIRTFISGYLEAVEIVS